MSPMQTIPTCVFKVFQGIAPAQRQALLEVRELIFDVATKDPRIGPIQETLLWGEPAYVTTNPKTGSTSRQSPKRSKPSITGNHFTTVKSAL